MPEFVGRGGVPPPPSAPSEALLNEILDRIRQKGPITFAEFMELALYCPGLGYYTSGRDTWGGSGDYITSLDVSPVFSRTLAKEVHEMWTILGSPADFLLIEAGAGRGWLSNGILDTVKEKYPGLYDAIRLEVVERNPHLREEPSEKVRWHESLSGIKPGGTGVILTNELIDSFPVHRVVFEEGLTELYVGHDGSSFIETPGPLSTPELGEYFREAGVEPFKGMRTEVNLEARRWMRSAAKVLGKGFVITIDYGLPARELYGPERRGSLLCHFRHTLNDNPFVNIGAQDITTHVDFTSLANAGRGAGLELTGFTTQKNLLLGLGVLEELQTPESFGIDGYEKINFNRALSRLIMPGGMGDTFKVLIQHTGIEKKPLLGFSFKDMSYCL